jgi:hypothetical protein
LWRSTRLRGRLELRREAVNATATRDTRLIADVAADVLAGVEAEDRPALLRFGEGVLPHGGCCAGVGYRHAMFIEAATSAASTSRW